MNIKSRTWRSVFAVLLIWAMIGSAGGIVTAQSAGPARAIDITSNEEIDGILVGRQGGAFVYYSIEYPGADRLVNINLEYFPADPVTVRGVGFNVYSNEGTRLGPAEIVGGGGATATQSFSFVIMPGDTWLIQVYNYIPDQAVTYRITVEGLGPEPTPTPVPTEEVAGLPLPVIPEQTVTPPEEAISQEVTVLPDSFSGQLMGDRGGAYEVQPFIYTGDNSELTITMYFSPDNPVVAPGIGFNVYGPSGLVARGMSTGVPTQRRATFSSDEGGVYTLQIYNYIDGLIADYTIETESS